MSDPGAALAQPPPSAADELTVPLLKNLPFPQDRHAPLPYRVDLLADHGIRLRTTESPGWPGLRRLPPHVVQTAALLPDLGRAAVALAMFESSAHPLALARLAGGPLARARLAVVSCWLPEVLAAADPGRLAWYRRAYTTVDRLFCFSQNQVEPLAELLDLPAERIRAIPFGVDDTEFTPPPTSTDRGSDDGSPLVLAAGRDRGRDWGTLFAALERGGTPCRVLCRPADLRGHRPPENVEIVGFVDRDVYRAELQRADVVLVITDVLGYPTGQSVLLEAMACGRCCIVTATPAMADYVEDGVDALTVPPHDVGALGEVLAATLADPGRRRRIGRAARDAVEARFAARHLWATVAEELHRLAALGRA